ncbi:DUF982 domain-containing protein [Mesorhizobium sp. ESP6-5]|uniref:DUF982 domain-containing protein n=1 Tax=Mesorhizobium sp. ESP6-5 TaxID=2876623 RepID=UPI001CC95B1A|nr:DUF982 domain-containing protein [Mesorhizobium sp. ESP6-5]MBZ9756186.1 DUF982 domain-containing protein [Mesorhizobium sp. ESP6-5]
MQTAWFSKPVVVSVGVAGAIRNLSNTQQAIELLTTHWRDAGSLKHQSALRACRRTMSGDLPPEIAREAFVEAAREAHILVEQVQPDRE